MLIAIFYTAYFMLAFAGFFVLAAKDELPINEGKSAGSVLLMIVFSGLGLWWIVATLGWTTFTIFLLMWSIAMSSYSLAHVLVTGRIYYPILVTVAGLGIQGWLVVLLWQAVIN